MSRRSWVQSLFWSLFCTLTASQSLHAELSLDEFLSSPKYYRTQLARIDKLNSANVQMVAEDKRTEVLAMDLLKLRSRVTISV